MLKSKKEKGKVQRPTKIKIRLKSFHLSWINKKKKKLIFNLEIIVFQIMVYQPKFYKFHDRRVVRRAFETVRHCVN